ncbi:MAG: RsmE family RNA methyltransferase [Stygiobacter sp.]
MQTNILSDIELYYSQNYFDEKVVIKNEEAHHAINVMRHKVDDIIFITNGKGDIGKSKIVSISKNELTAVVIEKYSFSNDLSNFTLCIPHIKKQDRLEFALEKSVELGFTNFIIYDSDRSVAKGDKTNRWDKILLSAMKQSLRSWLPKVEYKKSVSEIILLEGRKILFEQKSSVKFLDLLNNEFSIHKLSTEAQLTINNSQFAISNSQFSISNSQFAINNYLIFGPEGGFSEKEMKIFDEVEKVRLTNNRLRSETAIVSAASLISITLTQ